MRDRVYPVFRDTRYDVADVHLYGPVELDPLRIEAIRERIGKRPLISTECGGPMVLDNESYDPEDHFLAVMERNLSALSEGLAFCLWWRLGEGKGSPDFRKVALVERQGKIKPGYRAYQLLATILNGVDRVERRGAGHQYWLHRRGQTPLLVAWKRESDGDVSATLSPGVATGHVLRVTDAIRGTYVIDTMTTSARLALSRLPIVAGETLPEALYPSR